MTTLSPRLGSVAFRVFIQIFFAASLFYILTAGAFLFDWTWHLFFEGHRVLHQGLVVLLSLIFVLVFFLISRQRGAKIVDLEPFWSIKSFFDLPAKYSMGVLAILFFTLHFASQTMMHLGLGTSLWDLGLYDQVIWNTAHDHFLITSVRGGIHVFSERFKPFLALLASVYWYSNDTTWLLFIYNILHTLSLIAVYAIAKRILRSHNLALLMAFGAFFYAPMRNGIDFLFHTQVLADPLILIGYYLVLTKRHWLICVIPFALAMGCKESVMVDVLGLSLFLILSKRSVGWILLAMSLAGISIFCGIIEPLYRCPGTFLNKWNFYSYLSHPLRGETVRMLLTPSPVKFLFLIFLPFVFLPVLSPHSLFLLGPSLLFRLLSAYGGFRLTTAHYTGGLNALIFIGAIHGLQVLLDSLFFQRAYLWTQKKIGAFPFAKTSFAASILFFFFFACSGSSNLFRLERFTWEGSNADNQAASKILESIPQELSVLSTEKPAAHLSHRPFLFVFGQMFPGTPYRPLLDDPDLIVVDKFDSGNVANLDRYLKRGYQKILQTRMISIYQRPAVDGMIPGDLLVRWQKLSEAPPIPYRKIVKWWYKRLIVAVCVIFVLVITVRAIRRKEIGA